MATSGTYTFNLDAAQMVREAWERMQQPLPEMTGWQLRSARVSLNLMLIDWATKGVNLWAVEQLTQTLTAGVASFSTPAGTIDLLEAYVTVNGDDRVLTPLGRDEYVLMPNKATSGDPSQYWVEKILPTPVVHVYPVQSATRTLTYYRLRMLQDVSAAYQTVDAPRLFLEAMCAGLAAKLAVKWVKDAQLRGELRAEAKSAFNSAFNQDTERAPFSITPDMSAWRPW